MKTVRNFILSGLLLIAVSTFAQQTETRNISSFTKLDVGGSFDVILEKGSQPSVKLSYENIDPQKVVTKNEGNTLKIYLENGNYHNMRLKIYVTYTSINSISRGGSGNLRCESDIVSSGDFYLSSSGSGNINLGKLKAAGNVDIDRSGSGNVNLDGLDASTINMKFSGSGNFSVDNGNTKSQSIQLSGSGNVNAYGLKSQTCSVSVAGSGDIEVYVSGSISADIVGSGNINYEGSGTIKEVRVAGSGRLNKRS